MTALLDGFPGVEMLLYHFRCRARGRDGREEGPRPSGGVCDDLVHLDFWDGMTSVEGYRAIRYFDDIFYKMTHTVGALGQRLHLRLQSAVFPAVARVLELGLRLLAVSTGRRSPGSTRAPGESAYDDAKPPEYVAEQLQAMSRWGMGGEFANYVYGGLDSRLRRLLELAAEPRAGRRGRRRRAHGDAAESASRARWRARRTTTSLCASSAGRTIVGGSGIAKLYWQIRGGDARPATTGE